ncbi:MAG: glycosyltransferase family 4 protein [Phycisphaerales bacterium]
MTDDPMRVLLLNQTFYPDVAATAQHGHDLARTLVADGHEVVAIASRSIYGRKGAALPAHEFADGIEIHRVGASVFGKSGGSLGRLIDFGLWYLLAAWKAFRIRRCDVCVAFTTPPFIALVGVALRWFRRTKLVYWVMDLYPDVPVLYGMMRPRGVLTRILESIHRFILRQSDRVIALGRCMEERLRAKGAPPDRLRVVRVWADRNEVRPKGPGKSAYRASWDLDSKFVAMYSGNFGMMHDATTLLEAARALRDRDDIVFLIVGGGARRAEAEAFVAEHGLTNVRFEPYQPRESLDELLILGDVHLISMIDGAEGLVVPCKLFGILAAARPAVFIGPPLSEIGRVIEEEGCGAVIEVGDTPSLVATIERYAANRAGADADGAAGRRALEHKYDRSLACDSIRTILLEVVGATEPTSSPVAECDANSNTTRQREAVG